MAVQDEIEATYNYMDRFWRLSMGEHADITGALYNGNYSKSLEQAQQDKHDYILSHIRFRPGLRVLDIGCGWGGFLSSVEQKGGRGLGLTLSTRQAEACRRSGLAVYVQDWKTLGVDTFGCFDGVVSIGAFEHFCSETEYLRGEQESIYQRFFKLCHDLLPRRGRLFLQTMTWGKKVPEPRTISLQAPKGSDEYILAVLRKFFPGSWLPIGVEQISGVASPYFEVLSISNGRQDYIVTMAQWNKRLRRFSLLKLFAACGMIKYVFMDRDFYYRMEALLHSYNQECFRREVMDHYRVVLEKP